MIGGGGQKKSGLLKKLPIKIMVMLTIKKVEVCAGHNLGQGLTNGWARSTIDLELLRPGQLYNDL